MTEYHSSYFAHELSRRHSLNDSEKLASALAEGQVDLNPQQLEKDGNRNPLNPFDQGALVICSYQFAAKNSESIMTFPWDLAVIDESHRLRNVYKPDNKIAKAIKTALFNTPKILLTATPLQNSLMELYGLVSVIDEYAFGDDKSFRTQYERLTSETSFDELKARLTPICHRTLRRQVLEYIRYTNRIPLTCRLRVR